MCIVDGILIILSRKTGEKILAPFKVSDVKVLIVASNVPSAASLELGKEALNRVQRSHLVI